jgi:dolichol kinase
MPAESLDGVDALALQVRALLLGIDPGSLGADARARARRALEDVRRAAATLAAAWDDHHGDSTREVRLRHAVERLLSALPEPDWLGDARSEWLLLRDRLAPIYAALAEALPQPEVQDRAAHPRPENPTRSLVHVASGVSVVVAFHALLSPATAWIVALPWASFAWGLEISRRLSPRWNDVLMAVLGRIAHAHEVRKVNSSTWYSTAMLALAVTIPGPAAMLGILALAVGDPAAAWVGRRYGRIRIGTGRSLEGTLAFTVTSLAAGLAYLALIVPSMALPVALVIAVPTAAAAAATEAFVRRVDDNLAVPIVAAAVAYAIDAFAFGLL